MGSEMKCPIYTRGTVSYSQDPRDYICYICPDQQNKSLEQHLEDENHLVKFKEFTKSIVKMASIVYHKMAPKAIDFGRIIESALTDALPEEDLIFLFKNYISKRGNRYFCHLCNIKLPFWWVVESHNKGSQHQALRDNRIDESHLENSLLSILYYKLVVNNSIFMKKPQSMFCYLCENDVGSSYDEIITHIETKCHIEQQHRHNEALGRFSCEGYFNNNTENQESGVIMSSRSECNSSTDGRGIDEEFVSFCTEYNYSLEDHVEEDINANNQEIIATDVTEEVEELRGVKKASLPFNDAKNGRESSMELEGIMHIQDGFYICLLCDCKIPGLVNVRGHVEGSKHRKEVLKIRDDSFKQSSASLPTSSNASQLSSKVVNEKIPKLPKEITQVNDTSYTCCSCKCNLSGLKSLEQHLIGSRHRKSLQLPKEIIQSNDGLFTCSLCKCHISGEISAREHVRGGRHQRAFLQQHQGRASSGLSRKTGGGNSRDVNEDFIKTLASSISTFISNSQKNQTKSEDMFEGITEIGTGSILCAICDNRVFPLADNGSIMGHLHGRTHQMNLKKKSAS